MLFTILGVALFCYGIFYAVLLCFLDCDLQLGFYEKFGKSIGRLQGKVVFITGASSGIGKHTALALAKHGVKLVLAARRRPELEAVKARCIDMSGTKLTDNDVLVLPMDMLNVKSHQKYFDTALRHFGHIDILFNNAGRSQRAVWDKIDLSVDKEVFELNVFSVVNLTRIAVSYFHDRGVGHVAVTSSLAGVMGVPLSASYTASKHCIHGYFDSLRIEKLGTNSSLAVSVICPGPIFTEFLQECFTEKSGEKYGISAQSTDRRMTGERCGQLCAVTLANKLNETWMGLFPLMLFTYIFVYFPVTRDIFLKVIGPQKLFRLRDSNVTEIKKK